MIYALLPEHRNRGFVSEMAEDSLRIDLEQLDFPEVIWWTVLTNRASQRVMEKLGFRYEWNVEVAGLGHCIYRLPVVD